MVYMVCLSDADCILAPIVLVFGGVHCGTIGRVAVSPTPVVKIELVRHWRFDPGEVEQSRSRVTNVGRANERFETHVRNGRETGARGNAMDLGFHFVPAQVGVRHHLRRVMSFPGRDIFPVRRSVTPHFRVAFHLPKCQRVLCRIKPRLLRCSEWSVVFVGGGEVWMNVCDESVVRRGEGRARGPSSGV